MTNTEVNSHFDKIQQEDWAEEMLARRQHYVDLLLKQTRKKTSQDSLDYAVSIFTTAEALVYREISADKKVDFLVRCVRLRGEKEKQVQPHQSPHF